MRKTVFLIAILTFVLCFSFNLWAVDELYLCGKVKEVFKDKVVVEVITESCRGIKGFSVLNREVLELFKGRIGENICFSITSDSCEGKSLIIKEID